MTLEEKVGQLFLATCPDSSGIEDIQSYHLGGYILFQKDFENQSSQSISLLIDAFQAASPIPMLIAVDEEGGTVCRVSSNPALASTRFPSPLSPNVHRYLRETMAFDGVIVTDDLIMGAITSQYGCGEAAVLAVLAGNDLLCSTAYREQYQAVLDAVKSGRIAPEDLDRSVSRILHRKQALGLLPQ